MTDIKKTAKDKGGATTKKLRLNKETLKDLDAKEQNVKGGKCCSRAQSGCVG